MSRVTDMNDQGNSRIVHYGYDALGRTTAVNYYRSGNAVGSMAYDYQNRYDPQCLWKHRGV